MLLLIACEQGPSTTTHSRIHSDSLDTPLQTDSDSSSVEIVTPPTTDCSYDPEAFRQEMGIGLVTLSYHGYPFTVYPQSDGSGSPLQLDRSDTFDRVRVSGKPDDYFQWYSTPNEYEGGRIIWRDSAASNGAIGIALNDTVPTYWLLPDSQDTGRQRFSRTGGLPH